VPDELLVDSVGMKACVIVFVTLGACGYPPLKDLSDDANAGAPPDVAVCFGSFVRICFQSASNVPTMPVMLPDVSIVEIDTDIASLCDQNNDHASAYCVVAGAGFTLPANRTIRAYGSKPLVLLSTTTFDLLGVVDVSSNRAGGAQAKGAGADPVGLCIGATAAQAAGGGFGGSFGGKGGDGEQVDAVAGGTAGMVGTLPTILRSGRYSRARRHHEHLAAIERVEFASGASWRYTGPASR
jgi:hypothetical protein